MEIDTQIALKIQRALEHTKRKQIVLMDRRCYGPGPFRQEYGWLPELSITCPTAARAVRHLLGSENGVELALDHKVSAQPRFQGIETRTLGTVCEPLDSGFPTAFGNPKLSSIHNYSLTLGSAQK
jgi:hypothetical protein